MSEPFSRSFANGASVSSDGFNTSVTFSDGLTLNFATTELISVDNVARVHSYENTSSLGYSPAEVYGVPGTGFAEAQRLNAIVNLDHYWAGMLEEAAPNLQNDFGNPVSTGSTTTVMGVFPVSHFVDEENRTVVNITNPGHIFHDGLTKVFGEDDGGLVVRHLIETEDGFYVQSIGIGSGDNKLLNDLLGSATWAVNVEAIKRNAILHAEIDANNSMNDLPGSITNIRDQSSQNGDTGSMRPEFHWDAVKNQIGMKVFDANDPNKVLAYVQNDGVVYQTPANHYYTENMLDHYGQKKNHSDGSNTITTSFGGTFRAIGDALGFDGEFGIQGTFAKKDGSEGKDSEPTDAKPIILDLDGDGVEIEVNGDVSFDMDADGYLEQTAWASADDAFLVIDLNADGTRGAGDGKIDQTKELVLTQFTESDLVTDLQALSFFDQFVEWGGDNNGILDAGDDVWDELRIWQDFDQDGEVDDGELRGLNEIFDADNDGVYESGISSINLEYDDGTAFEDTSSEMSSAAGMSQ